MQSLLTSDGEREEAHVEALIRSQPGVTRANTIGMISPKGGVGKTTSTFLVGNMLATHLRLRVLAMDANPDFGTLAALAPDGTRAERNLADLIGGLDSVTTAAEVGAYVSRMPSGLHLLGAPTDPETMDRIGIEAYGQLLAFLSIFYEVILLDMGTGITDPLVAAAIERCDQLVLVTTPEWVTSQSVARALGYLDLERMTLALNQVRRTDTGEAVEVERKFRKQRVHRSVTIPRDERLRAMLDTGTYSLDALDRPTRLAVKHLGLAVAERLV